ncbi:unnamed protein product [Closterium sp. Yama58-4]|nr:unnamed protein product [Closterium sp. Yama58-4]
MQLQVPQETIADLQTISAALTHLVVSVSPIASLLSPPLQALTALPCTNGTCQVHFPNGTVKLLQVPQSALADLQTAYAALTHLVASVPVLIQIANCTYVKEICEYASGLANDMERDFNMLWWGFIVISIASMLLALALPIYIFPLPAGESGLSSPPRTLSNLPAASGSAGAADGMSQMEDLQLEEEPKERSSLASFSKLAMSSATETPADVQPPRNLSATPELGPLSSKILPHLFKLYGCTARDEDFQIYSPDAKFDDPLMSAHGLNQIKSAFYSMQVLFQEGRIVEYTLEETSTGDGSGLVVMDNKQNYRVWGRPFDVDSRIQLKVEGGKVVHHEDLWNKKPLWSDPSNGFLGWLGYAWRRSRSKQLWRHFVHPGVVYHQLKYLLLIQTGSSMQAGPETCCGRKERCTAHNPTLPYINHKGRLPVDGDGSPKSTTIRTGCFIQAGWRTMQGHIRLVVAVDNHQVEEAGIPLGAEVGNPLAGEEGSLLEGEGGNHLEGEGTGNHPAELL